jgi:hypothetical protein
MACQDSWGISNLSPHQMRSQLYLLLISSSLTFSGSGQQRKHRVPMEEDSQGEACGELAESVQRESCCNRDRNHGRIYRPFEWNRTATNPPTLPVASVQLECKRLAADTNRSSLLFFSPSHHRRPRQTSSRAHPAHMCYSSLTFSVDKGIHLMNGQVYYCTAVGGRWYSGFLCRFYLGSNITVLSCGLNPHPPCDCWTTSLSNTGPVLSLRRVGIQLQWYQQRPV